MESVLNINRLDLGLAAVALVTIMSACAGMNRNMSGKTGMTYYTFDKDVAKSGKSACYGRCAVNWPPVSASESSGDDYGTITREDGSRQLTHDGRPLYYFIGDKKPGDHNGDGLKGVWHVVSEDDGHKAHSGGAQGGSGSY